MTDPIADYLTRLRNAIKASHRIVEIPASNLKKEITKVLHDKGYIQNYKFEENGPQGTIKIALKYNPSTKQNAIVSLERVSTPGLRKYAKHDELPRVINGLGIAIVSTSKGVMTDKEARTEGIGGEGLCYVYSLTSMSRIGKKPIHLPNGVTVDVSVPGAVTVKGPKGTLTQDVNPDIQVKVEGSELVVSRPTDSKRHKSMHGLYRALINNMVVGVSEGYKKDLELVGVGYKASNQGQVLELSLGYSHSIFMALPQEISLKTETPKGKNPIITLEGIDKELIGQVAAKIRSLRKVEPYKGKGVRFVGEQVRRKAGKTAGKK